MNTLPDLSSRELVAVLALAEHRSFIATAAHLRISQPALTRTIKQVERSIGVDLFSRSTRQVVITPAGKEFVSLAERLLNDLKISIEHLQSTAAHVRGQIIVSSVLPFAGDSFSKVITEYQSTHPGIEIQLREGLQSNVVDDVRGGIADIGIGYVDGLPGIFHTQSLGVEALHVVVPTKHPWAAHQKIAVKELKGARLISYPVDSRTRKLVDTACGSNGFAPFHAITVNRHSTLMNLVRGGAGIAVVPSSERPSSTDNQLTSRPLRKAKLSRLGLFYLTERTPGVALADFMEEMRRWLRQVAPTKLKDAKSRQRAN